MLFTVTGCSSGRETLEQDSVAARSVMRHHTTSKLRRRQSSQRHSCLSRRKLMRHRWNLIPLPMRWMLSLLTRNFNGPLDLGCEHDVDGDITFTEPEFEAQLAHR